MGFCFAFLPFSAIAQCPYGRPEHGDRSIDLSYLSTYIYTSSIDAFPSSKHVAGLAPFPGSSLLPRNNFKEGGRSLGTRLRTSRRKGARIRKYTRSIFPYAQFRARAPERGEGNWKNTSGSRDCVYTDAWWKNSD